MKSSAPEIVERTFRFATRIIRVVRAIPRTIPAEVLARQVMRSGNSIGANVEEAQSASTKKEFVRKMEIAQSEARETLYWLRLLAESELVPGRLLVDLIREADELVRIITAIARNARGR